MPSKGPRKKAGKASDLPVDVLDQVDRLLVEGTSYEDISDFLAEQGFEISKTAIGRHGEEFFETCRKLRVMEEKSRVLASHGGEGLILEEAASRLLAQTILEALLSGEIQKDLLPKILSDFTRLQSSNVQREKLRESMRRTEKSAEDEDESGRRGGLSDEAAAEIRRKILGLPE